MSLAPDDPRLAPYRALRERDLRAEGLFVAEGRLAVQRLLTAGWEPLSVLCTPAQAARFTELAAGRCPVLVEEPGALARVAGFPFHRGVLAAGRRPAFPELGAFLHARAARTPRGPLTLVLCPRLSDTENLGSIIRSSAAFGAGALAIGERCCDALSRRAIKASAGSAFALPLLRLGDEARDAALLESLGFELVGACGDPEGAAAAVQRPAQPGRTAWLPEYRRPDRVALVLGNEAVGLEEPWLSGCRRLLAVPMPGHVDSLNVGVAAGIILWELAGRSGERSCGRKKAPRRGGASAAEQN